MNGHSDSLLQVRGLKKHFAARGLLSLLSVRTWVRAVDGISFYVRPGETFSLVGESGCGKTTTAKLLLLLEQPTAGNIYFDGQDINQLKGSELRRYRSLVQAVFQDPWSSLNPRMRASSIIAEPLVVNHKPPKQEVQRRVEQLLMDVGLEPAAAANYPHEFSGGQRQRVAVARALALNPRLIVLDEPVSALDVSIRAQIMNLLRDLQRKYGMSYFLIAHNLATVRYLSHQVAVMYLGLIVEQATSEELFTKPLHPYTKALISAALPTQPGVQQERILLSGEVPSATHPPSGCRFHTRCPFVFDRCAVEAPQLRELAPGHTVACHLY
ncbi:MAG: ATP-binding cassette domain-containing protein [Deltaproteobacteria bacterium]|nr:ATP-binding cassette domain-containing protein [Deltaproteobacteria bacterium]